jgi:hypothetical protein
MSEVKGRIDREVSAPSPEAPAALTAGAPEAHIERSSKRAGALSLSGWMSTLLDQLSDDELPRS